MNQTTRAQKVGLVFFGIVLTVIILELSLRAAGSVIITVQEFRNRRMNCQGDIYRILCVGESTTMSGGENSYPRQLERILNEKGKGKRFQVLNKGMDGTNTNVILSKLRDVLEQEHPQMVIAMMGINDAAEMISIEEEIKQRGIKSKLKDMRVYKLIKRINVGIKANINQHKDSQTSEVEIDDRQDQFGGIDDIFRYVVHEIEQELREKDMSYHDLYMKGFLLKATGHLAEAEKIFRVLIAAKIVPKQNGYFYKMLADCLKGQNKKEEMIEILNKIPLDAWGNYHALEFCQEKESFPKIVYLLKQQIAMTPNNADIYDVMADCFRRAEQFDEARLLSDRADHIRGQQLNAVTRSNYQRLNRMLLEKNVKPVYMQYPMRDINTLKLTLKGAPNFDEILFVSNKENFQAALKEAKYDELFVDRFAGNFGHCTDKGNQLLAEHLAEEIISQLTK